MDDTKFRARFDRIVAGANRPDDVQSLFLALRDRNVAKPTVEEVANFLAHGRERDRGIASRHISAWYELFDVVAMSVFEASPLTTVRASALVGVLGLHREEWIEHRLGVGRDRATRLIRQAASKDFGRIRPLPDKEQALVEAIEESIPSAGMMSAAELMLDLEESLAATEILPALQAESIHNAATFITLFVVAELNRTLVKLPDRGQAQIRADQSATHPTIGLWATCEFKHFVTQGPAITWQIFKTGLASRDFLAPEARSQERWEFPLEVRHGKLLGALR